MRDYLNLTQPVEITDFFISLMTGLNLEIRDIAGKDFSQRNYWDRLIDFLKQDLKIKDIELEGELPGGKIGISASLKDDPTFKIRLQEQLRGHVYKVVNQAHEFAREMVTSIRQRENDPSKKVVLIIDSVEQIRGVGEDANKVYQSVENLFSAHADKLYIPLLHVVYTTPPYLVPLAPNLGQILGGSSICNLPSIHIRKRDGSPDYTGLSTMRQILERRYSDYRSVFTEEQVDRMALSTSGDFRSFFRLVRDCLVKAASTSRISIPDSVITDAENHLLRDMLPIADDDKAWLRKISASKSPELPTVEKLPQLARFFDTHLVMNYRNAEDWYDINPLLSAEIAKDGS